MADLSMICNALTFDVEDYFQVYAFSKVIRYEDWGSYECRVEQNTDHILNLLDGDGLQRQSESGQSGRKCNKRVATFFILGWIAERFPALVKRISELGHEVACHGYAHKPIYEQSREDFRQDVRRAKALLEDITGKKVIGYRAPMYSITNRSRWALEILIQEGFCYDSSIFPIRHDFYGLHSAPRFPFSIHLDRGAHHNLRIVPHSSDLNREDLSKKSLIEMPPSTIRVCGQNIPVSGGGYFRLFPYRFIKRALRTINSADRKPFIFYLHPWEFDRDQPRIRGIGLKSYFRHYNNLHTTESKFKRLLQDFSFTSIEGMLKQRAI